MPTTVTAADWTVFPDDEQARVRYSLMRELARFDATTGQTRWWQDTYRMLLALKRAASLTPCAEARPLFKEKD